MSAGRSSLIPHGGITKRKVRSNADLIQQCIKSSYCSISRSGWHLPAAPFWPRPSFPVGVAVTSQILCISITLNKGYYVLFICYSIVSFLFHVYFIVFKNGCQGNFLPLHQWIKFLQKIDHYCIMTPFFKCSPYEISGMHQRRPWTDGTLETPAMIQGPKGQALRRETLRQKDRGDFSLSFWNIALSLFFCEWKYIPLFFFKKI